MSQKHFNTDPFCQALHEALPPEKRRMRYGDAYVVAGKDCFVVFYHSSMGGGRGVIGIIQGHVPVIQTDIVPEYHVPKRESRQKSDDCLCPHGWKDWDDCPDCRH